MNLTVGQYLVMERSRDGAFAVSRTADGGDGGKMVSKATEFHNYNYIHYGSYNPYDLSWQLIHSLHRNQRDGASDGNLFHLAEIWVHIPFPWYLEREDNS